MNHDININLALLKKQMEEIAGAWNGDEPGQQEDRAHQANDILEKIRELEQLLSDLDEI